MLPWLRNVQLVGVTANDTSNNSKYLGDSAVGALEDGKIPLPHVEMSGDGWGSSKATQLVLNNLFFLTVKVWYFLFELWNEVNLVFYLVHGLKDQELSFRFLK